VRAWRYFVALFSRREPGTTLAVFRIAAGLVILYSLLSIAAADLVEALWVNVEHGGMRNIGGSPLARWLGGPTPGVIWMIWTAALVATLAFIAGLGGRITSFVLLQTYLGLVSINGDASGGYDLMITNALWLLTLGQATATLSVDCRLRTGRWTCDREVAAWPRCLLIFQLMVIYTATGLQKSSVWWTPAGEYSALYWVFQDPTWTRFSGELFAWIYPITQVGTAVTWHWEQLSILMLLYFYFRDTVARPGRIRRWFTRWDLRKPWVVTGLLVHIGILLTLNVGPFSWISMAYYLVLWRGEELEAAARRVAGALGRLRRRRASASE